MRKFLFSEIIALTKINKIRLKMTKHVGTQVNSHCSSGDLFDVSVFDKFENKYTNEQF